MGALFTIALLLSSAVWAPDKQASHAEGLLREEYWFGSFRNATRITQNPQGWLYVLDTDENTVFLFQAPREQPRSIGGFGWGATTFDRPTGISTDGLTLYVADYNNHRIQRFDRNLNYLSSFSTRDTNITAARFGFPTGVAISRLGNLFVLDSENNRVLKFSGSLQLERAFGGIESEQGRLHQPLKLLLSPHDHLYVLEPHRLVEFDYYGNLIKSIGEGTIVNARGFDVANNEVMVVAEDSLFRFSVEGELKDILPASHIVASVPLVPLRDVALVGERVFLLTQHRVVAMKIVTGSDR